MGIVPGEAIFLQKVLVKAVTCIANFDRQIPHLMTAEWYKKDIT
jgi:hypothetical protein